MIVTSIDPSNFMVTVCLLPFGRQMDSYSFSFHSTISLSARLLLVNITCSQNHAMSVALHHCCERALPDYLCLFPLVCVRVNNTSLLPLPTPERSLSIHDGQDAVISQLKNQCPPLAPQLQPFAPFQMGGKFPSKFPISQNLSSLILFQAVYISSFGTIITH